MNPRARTAIVISSLAVTLSCASHVEPDAPTMPSSVGEQAASQVPATLPCRLDIPTPRAVEVRLYEEFGDFEVVVNQGRVGATLGSEWETVDVEVEAALEFSACISTSGLQAWNTERLQTELVTVAPGSSVVGLRQGETSAEAAFVIGDMSEGLFVELRPVPFDCGSLSFAPRERDNSILALHVEDATLRVAAGEWIELSSAVDERARVNLHGSTNLLPFWLVGTNGSRGRVVWRLTNGSELQGFVPLNQLREPTPDERERIDCAFGVCLNNIGDRPATGGLGLRGIGRGSGGEIYLGPATVRVGTPVYREPWGEVAWARTGQEVEFQVYWVRGSEWVRLVDVPGLRVQMPGEAWVERSKVTIPGVDEGVATPATSE